MLNKITYLSLFPEVIQQGLEYSLLEKAVNRKLFQTEFVQVRNFATDKHQIVDEPPFGGGPGMLMKVDVLHQAWKNAVNSPEGAPLERTRTILMSPQGAKFTQEKAKQLVQDYDHLVLVSGHYEGVDERFIELCVDEELSIGDYVLTGGEYASMVVTDVLVRLIPGVVGREDSVVQDSLEGNLLKYPQYTRPREYEGHSVPDVLLSGNHIEIEKWRKEESLKRTLQKRPDLVPAAKRSRPDRVSLVLLHYPVTNRKGEVVTTAVTNIDLHDLSRSARTYEVDDFFVVTPIPEQHEILNRILGHWRSERSRDWHPDRYEALSRLKLVNSFEDVKAHLRKVAPKLDIEVVMPDARPLQNQVSYESLKTKWQTEPKSGAKVIVLGTGWGVAPEFYKEIHTYLGPIYGPLGADGYNHLSVRAAGGVILDRLFGSGIGIRS